MPRRNRRHTRQFKKYKKEKKKPPFKTTVIAKRSDGTNVYSGPVTASGKPAGQSYASSFGSWYNCEHWQTPFELQNGLIILASASRDRPTLNEEWQNPSIKPDIGFYLDSSWNRGLNIMTTPGLAVPWIRRTSTQVVMYPWADFQEPDSIRQFDRVIRWLLDLMAVGRTIETGCIGGHGRTGTLLACLLVAQGMSAWDAILHVRKTYCDQAVESWKQEEFIEDFDGRLNGRDEWPNKPTYKWTGSTKTTPASHPSQHDTWCDQALDRDNICICGAEDEVNYEEWLKANTLQGGQDTAWDQTARKLIEGDADKIAASVMADIMGPVREANAQADAEYRAANDARCHDAPCAFPAECDASTGECWKKLTTPQDVKSTAMTPPPRSINRSMKEAREKLDALPPPTGTIYPSFDKDLGHVVWRDKASNLLYDYSIGKWLTVEELFAMRMEKKQERDMKAACQAEAAADEGASS